jgi:hypothetical protein
MTNWSLEIDVSRHVPELRSGRFVVLAYVVAPAASIALLWFGVSVFELSIGRYTLNDVLPNFPLMVGYGGVFGIFVELIVVTPLLLAFRRYRWDWFNVWWAGGAGFLLRVTGNQLLLAFLGRGRWFGWGSLLQSVLVSGFVGVAAGAIFYLVAVRTVARSPGVDLGEPIAPHASKR